MAPSNVPRFTSFRPKPKHSAQSHEHPSKADDLQWSRDSSRLDVDKSSTYTPAFQTSDQGKDIHRPYFSDRRGDSNILRYGTLASSDIPTYHRHGYGHVLGLHPSLKIEKDHSTSQGFLITSGNRPRQERRLTDKQHNFPAKTVVRLVQAGYQDDDRNLDFISFSRRETKDADGNHYDFNCMTANDTHNDRGNTNMLDNDDFEASPEYDLSRETDTGTLRKNSHLVRKTREHPDDLDAWLALADHQEAMLKLDQPVNHPSTSDETLLADLRVSIYEEALKKTRGDRASQAILYQRLLRDAQLLWNEPKLALRWQEVLSEYPSNADLWLEYLDFTQASFPTFKFENCRSNFLRSLEVLCKVAEPNRITILHILLRYTCMAYDAGYQELSIATWQALLEFVIMRPATDVSMHAFEMFWESENPRIGEPDAKGWRNQSGDMAVLPESTALPEIDSKSTTLDNFQSRERNFITQLRFPGRTWDEVGEDDAFHTILFSDFEQILKALPTEMPSIVMVDAFLFFMGLPPLPQLAMSERGWRKDPYLLRLVQRDLLNHAPSQGAVTDIYRNLADCTPSSLRLTRDLLFEDRFWVQDLSIARFVRRVLSLLIMESSMSEDIGEYLLAFELKHFPTEVKKTGRRLLKANPASQRLYNAYGLVEAHLGNNCKASQIFETAILLQRKNRPWTFDTLTLVYTWIWATIGQGGHFSTSQKRVSDICLSSYLVKDTSASQKEIFVLASTVLKEMIEHYLLDDDCQSAVSCTSLLAILSYLSGGYAIEEALLVHKGITAWLESHKLASSPVAEFQAQEIVRLLHWHIEHASRPNPSLIRTTLEQLVCRFPNNTHVLALYAANETRFTINDRLQGVLKRDGINSSRGTSIASWAFAIQLEQLRSHSAGSTAHSIRAIFKNVTESLGKHCPAIWKSYILFELDQVHRSAMKSSNAVGRADEKKDYWSQELMKAKQRLQETFFAGLQKLPWSKDYIMIAFTEITGVFDQEEERRLLKIMQEKEMRIYTDIEEL